MKELEENSSATVQSASEHEAREAALQQRIEDLQRLMDENDQALTVRMSELEAKSRDLDDAREALVRVCAAGCLLKNRCFARFVLACQYWNCRRLNEWSV
jgi:DNA repair exonuclease SbcCD ATPase subunit